MCGAKTWIQILFDEDIWPTLLITSVNGWLATYVKINKAKTSTYSTVHTWSMVGTQLFVK